MDSGLKTKKKNILVHFFKGSSFPSREIRGEIFRLWYSAWLAQWVGGGGRPKVEQRHASGRTEGEDHVHINTADLEQKLKAFIKSEPLIFGKLKKCGLLSFPWLIFFPT